MYVIMKKEMAVASSGTSHSVPVVAIAILRRRFLHRNELVEGWVEESRSFRHTKPAHKSLYDTLVSFA